MALTVAGSLADELPRSRPEWPEFLWHHRVHKEIAGETLSFWRLGFEPVYDRDSAVVGLRTAARHHGVRSLYSYEVFGAHDLLVRAWLPHDCARGSFHKALRAELAPAGLVMCDSFMVNDVLRHWPFASEQDGAYAMPAAEHLQALSPEEIEAMDDGASAPEGLAQRLADAHLLRPYTPEATKAGIKFAVAIAGAGGLDDAQVGALTESVIEVLNAASGIEQQSLYRGFGFGYLLIIGSVPGDRFYLLKHQLVAQLNAAVIRELYDTRTMTLVSGQRGFHIASEGLSHLGRGVRRWVPRRAVTETVVPARLNEDDRFADRFIIKRYLGGGGYAHVYRSYDEIDKVDRALKLFRASDPEAAERELSALRKLDHPNIVKVFWYGQVPGCIYLVNEFIDGKSLDEFVEGPDHHRGVIDEIEALGIVGQVLKALQYLHPDEERIRTLKAKGRDAELSFEEFSELERMQDTALIHRDIKPANIMLRDDGVVKVVDFNISSPADVSVGTKTHTPGFEPPDMSNRWEPDVDLFACGVVLYQLMCAGAKPYRDGRLSDDAPAQADPIELNPSLRPGVAALLRRACASDRSERFKSAREMRAAIETELAKFTKHPDFDPDRAAIAARCLRMLTEPSQ